VGPSAQNVRVVGRYALYQAIAAGGMATVHLGRLLGPVGFSRTVAIKRLHAQFASDPEFVSMFLDEARLAARIRHPNVVPTLDVVATGGELFLVMEYVPGESIARLSRALRERQQFLPTRILSAVMAGVLHGLHAAHEAKDERGYPLGIVHRDMSPQNVLVGTDGVARVLDFGVAKAAGRMQTTREGQIKGKLSYMPPEQLRGAAVSRQSDIYAAGVMLWELVTGQRLFSGDNEGAIVAKVLEGNVPAPSKVLMRGLNQKATINDNTLRGLEDLDSTILRALQMEPENRFATSREMALEIERKLQPATGSEVADWVEHIAKDVLNTRAAMVAEIESSASIYATDGRESHVQNVLSAKATIGPGTPGSNRMASAAAFAATQSNPSSPTLPERHQHGQTIALPGGPPVARPPYSGPIEGPPVTQPSSISVTAGTPGFPREQDRPGGRRTLVAAFIGVMLGASVLASALIYREVKQSKKAIAGEASATPTQNGDTATPTTPSTATASTGGTATATTPEAGDAGMIAADPGPTPVGSTPPAVSTVVAGTVKPIKPNTTRPPPNPTPRPPAPPPPVAAPPECATPYWFDAQGVKHYKSQCFAGP
jgi:eukaryotic-like serine/threonine-protein kinase